MHRSQPISLIFINKEKSATSSLTIEISSEYLNSRWNYFNTTWIYDYLMQVLIERILSSGTISILMYDMFSMMNFIEAL